MFKMICFWWIVVCFSFQSKFWFDDPTMRKVYVMGALGSRFKDVKLRLWKEYKRDNLSDMHVAEPTLAYSWESVGSNGRLVSLLVILCVYQIQVMFLRFQKMQERNTKNQKKHIMPHVCGRKSLSRRRNEIVSNLVVILNNVIILLYYYINFYIVYTFIFAKKIKTGKTPSRAEFFIETLTKPNGSFVSQDAKTRLGGLYQFTVYSLINFICWIFIICLHF